MTEPAAPHVFVIHESEDKERFVMPFAKALRGAGIDAWAARSWGAIVDTWTSAMASASLNSQPA